MLKRKMLRDLKTLKGQFFAIFFMCFLGVFVYSGIYAEWKGMENSIQDLYQKTKFADGWVLGNSIDVDALKSIEEINQMEARLLLPCSVAGNADHVLQVYALENNILDQMDIVDGEPFDAQDKEGIWLDKEYADINDYQIGDTITITLHDVSMQKTIRGLGYHPLYVYALKDNTSFLPDHATSGFAFVSKQDALLQSLPYNQVSIQSNAPFSMWGKAVKETFANSQIQVIAQKDYYSVDTAQAEINQHQAVGNLLPIVFLLVAVLSTLNTMQKVIMNQRVQIGTLKAVGFTRGKLYLHYMSHVLLLCAFGCILGAILGPITIPNMIYNLQKTMYSLPVWKATHDPQVIYVCIIIIFCCLFASYCAIHKTCKEPAARLLSGNGTYKGKMHQRNSEPKDSMFYIRWNLRDIFRNKMRSFLAFFGIMGCSGLLLCSLGLLDSIQEMIRQQYEVLHTYESRLELEETINEAQYTELKEQYDGEALLEKTIIIHHENEDISTNLNVLENTKYIHFNETNSIALPEAGVFISRKLANQLSLREGDEVIWQMEGQDDWQTSKINTIVNVPLSQGLFTSSTALKEQGISFRPTYLLSSNTAVQSGQGIKQVVYRENLLQNVTSMLEAMFLIVGILMFAALLLGMIVLYNFASLSFFERTREIATLKVLGFDNKKARKISRTQNEILCFCGILAGMPFGYALIALMAMTLSDSMDLQVYITWQSYAISIVITWLMMWEVTWFINRHIKKIDMVAALKEME